MKKAVSILLALVMVFSVLLPAQTFAEQTEEGQSPAAETTNTVTVHKLLMSKRDLERWDSDKLASKPGEKDQYKEQYTGKSLNLTGVQQRLGLQDEVTEISNVYFQWMTEDGSKYITVTKLANGSYKYQEKTAEQVKDLPDLTSVDSTALVANREYLMGARTGANGVTFNTKGMDKTYKIFEVPEKTTYAGHDGELLAASKAVPVKITLPLYNNDGVVTDAHVYPKNTQQKPKTDKDFGKVDKSTDNELIQNWNYGANFDNPRTKEQKDDAKGVQVNEKVPYEVKTVVKADSKYKTLSWSDTMSEGLTFNSEGPNKGVTLKNDGDLTLTIGTDYVVKAYSDGFVLTFTETGLNKVSGVTSPAQGQGKDITFTLTYSATVNSKAVVEVPETNDVVFHYHNNPKHVNEPKSENVKPKNKKIVVKKNWDEGDLHENVSVSFELYDASTGKLVKTLPLGDNTSVTFDKLDADKDYYVKEVVTGADAKKYVCNYEAAPGVVTAHNYNQPTPPEEINPDEPKVVTYGKKFVKTSDSQTERLAGAKFLVKNGEGAEALYLAGKGDNDEVNKYQQAQDAYISAVKAFNEAEKKKPGSGNRKTVEDAKATRDAAFNAMKDQYKWISATDDQDAINKGAVVLTSDNEGRFEISGLNAGTYYLVEIAPPDGYAKNETPQRFVVGKGTYAGTSTEVQYNEKDTDDGYGQRVINRKVSIPQTGGIGTIIFTVAGLTIMAAAAVALKKRHSAEA